MITRDQVPSLYTPIYDEFMLSAFAEVSQVNTQVFQSIDDQTKEYKVNSLSGLGVWTSADEAEDGNYEDPVEGYAKTFTQAKFRKRFGVTFEAVDQDEYALLKKEEDVAAMGRGARAKVELDTASILSDGFASTCPDGQYLFDTDHDKNSEETSTHYDNLLLGAFSHDNLEAAETLISNNLIDPTGLPIDPPEGALLVYSPALRGAVERVLSDRALEQPGTALRNINRFAGKYTPVEWRYLAAKFGGSDTAWFIVFKSMNMLKIIWSAHPHFTSWIDWAKEIYYFSGRMLYDCGATDWRGCFGSTGL